MSAPIPVVFESVTKRFGHTLANDAISCEIATGGIHAFLGENGAGKSTLMRVLCGSCQPDQGKVLIDGVSVHFRSSSDARRLGVGMVHQNLSLVPSMTVLDNILLGDRRVPFLLRRTALAAEVAEKAARLGFEFDLNTPVAALGASDRQKVEIFKLLWRDARILILDEPTSQLAPFEAEEILRIMRALAIDGRTVLLVSHNIGEVIRFTSRISVLARGRCVGTFDSRAARMEDLARLMVGDLKVIRRQRPLNKPGTPSLSVKDVLVHRSPRHREIRDIAFDIYPGEVLGVAGVAHSGQEEIAAILTGHLQPDRGSLTIDGRPEPWDVLRDRKACAAHIPSDVRQNALIESASLLDNLFLRDIFSERITRGPLLRQETMAREAKQRLALFGVQPDLPQLPCGVLSGGNLQKLVLARELSHECSFLVAINPTRGLDVAAADAVRRSLRDYTATGRSVVLISHDLQELIATSDRVVVLFDGEAVGTEPTDALNAESLGLLMGGVKAAIVRALLSGQGSTGTDELRAALRTLLDSENRWQRHLAAQVGLNVLGLEDVPIIRARLAEETYKETRIWLSLTLARLVGGAELEAVISAFALNPFGYVEAQQKLAQSIDHASLRDTLVARLGAKNADWETVLGALTLDYLGFSLKDDLRTALRSGDLPSVLRFADRDLAKSVGPCQ